MTIRQEAYGWIDKLPEDCVRIVIEVVMKMAASEAKAEKPEATKASDKLQAFQRMQELRKEMAAYDISETERGTALDEKYGSIPWVGGNT